MISQTNSLQVKTLRLTLHHFWICGIIVLDGGAYLVWDYYLNQL